MKWWLLAGIIAAAILARASATTMKIGFISCEEKNQKYERFMRYFEAAKADLKIPDSYNIDFLHLSISTTTPNQRKAEKMMDTVRKFVDKTDPGTALLGCWVRDTKIAIRDETGFPYFTYIPLFPDYLDKKDVAGGGQEFSVLRREEKLTMSVTTLTPPINAFVRPIVNYLRDNGVRTACVLVVGAESQLQFGDGLKDSADTNGIDLEFFRLTKWSPERDVIPTLISIRTRVIPHIIVHGNELNILHIILDKARELNMMTHHYVWYFTYPDFDGLLSSYKKKKELEDESVVVGMQLINRDIMNATGIRTTPEQILEDAFYYDVSTILLKAMAAQTGNPTNFTNVMLQDYVENTMIPSGNFEGALGKYGFMMKAPDKYKGRMMSRVSGEMTLRGIYFKEKNDNLAVSNIAITGINTPTQSLDVTVPKFKIQNVNGVKMPEFNEKVIKVVAKLDPPLIIYNKTGKLEDSGVMVDLMNQYTKILNVTWRMSGRVYNVENYGISKLHDKETIMDYLRDGRADIAIGAFGSNLQRAEIISFTDTTIPCAVSLLMKKPKLEYTITQFLTPFKTSMWASIFIVFIIVSILLTIMDILDWTDENFPVRDSFYYVAGVLLSGTTDTNPASFPSRMLVGCFIFFAIVTFQSYTANMAAFLTTRDEFQGIPRTLYDVATRTSKTIIGVNNSEIVTMLAKAKKDPYNQISTRIDKASSYEEAKRRVYEEDAVLVSDTSFTEYVTSEDDDCLYMDQEQDADTIRYAMALPYGAKYKEAVNEAIGELKTQGKDRNIIRTWYEQPACQLEQSGSGGNLQTKSLTMLEMSGIFITLGGGFVLSLLVAIFGELMVRYYYKKPGTNFLGVFPYFASFPRRFADIISVWTNAGRKNHGGKRDANSVANNRH